MHKADIKITSVLLSDIATIFVDFKEGSFTVIIDRSPDNDSISPGANIPIAFLKRFPKPHPLFSGFFVGDSFLIELLD